jgi:branched-chain amino acid transport system permease protein
MTPPSRTPLRDATFSALIALGLFVPLLGLRLDQPNSGLTLSFRPWPVAALVAATFAGRLLITLWPRRAPSTNRTSVMEMMQAAGRLIAPILLGLALILPAIPGIGRAQLDLAVLVLTYVMLGWGLNIVVGLAGLLDLGYVAFYAVGAYSFAILSQTAGLGFWTCLPIAGLLAAAAGLLLGFPVLRLRGDYLAIVTLGFGEIIRVILINWTSLTNGPNGIGGIPRPTFFGLNMTGSGPNSFAGFFGIAASPTHRFIFLYYLILMLALLTNWVTLRLRRLPLGRAWEALREDEIACRALGLNTTSIKLTAFAIGAGFGGLAGCFFATRQGFISPDSFTFSESAIVLAIVVLGGLGSQLGVALAALVMIGGFELFRDFATYRMIVFGLALVIIMVIRPRGLVSTRTPSLLLHRHKALPALARG